MPYYSRKSYKRRRRPLWRWRARGAFRRRPYRYWKRQRYYRYRYRTAVRKRHRKLPYLRLKEWQPPYIEKLKVRGAIPLFITTPERIVNNFSMYWYENVPHLTPGGGGFSIINFTLSAMYQLFEKCQCYWTKSNNEKPLIRFTGANIKLWRSEHADYISTFHSCYPLQPTLDTYNSTHPAIMTLNKRHRIVPCRQNRHYKKPYSKLKIKPPAPMKSKWYFQQDLADKPLCMLMTSAMSLDRMYQNSTSISTTVGFKTINTEIFQYHNWELPLTSGYKAADKKYLWALDNGTTHDITKEKVENLIFLGDTKHYKEGKKIKDSIGPKGETWAAKYNRYIVTEAEWGNPFMPKYLNQEVTVLISNKSPAELPSLMQPWSQNTTLGSFFTTPTKPLVIDCRYNPYQDSGNNHIFIEAVTKREQQPWELPHESKYIGHSFPLWLSMFGFIDYEKNTVGRQVDTDFVFLIVSDYIKPPLGFYLPIDEDFLKGRSKYKEENTLPTVYDQQHWHPKVVMQLSSINAIGRSGPGTIKLPKQTSAEAHCTFTFYFKLGGCGPNTQTIEDPQKQPVFPTPNNILQTTSLQSPKFPLEHFIYAFDKRRDFFTKQATERMLKIFPTKETIPSITDSNLFSPTYQTQETSSESSDEESQQTQALLQQLQQQRNKQRKFRLRIQQLIQQLNM
nr:MAG: ORF1 [TTV-like mini virus]